MGGEMETMGSEPTWAEARSALAWWLEAGVDVAIQEDARDWLSSTPAGVHGGEAGATRSNLVQPALETLNALQDWLASSAQLPLASASARRILPHGPEQAEIMFLSDSPTLEDLASGQPIGGEPWQLATRMLAAIGFTPEQAYSASLSCFPTIGARMSAEDSAACAEIARKHIRLVRPKRLLLLGEIACQALLGKPLIAARGSVHRIEDVPTVATFPPRQLINRPLDKAQAWKDLLLLMENAP